MFDEKKNGDHVCLYTIVVSFTRDRFNRFLFLVSHIFIHTHMSIEDIDATCVEDFDIYRATGLWHIFATNDTLWKNKLIPTITYSIHNQLSDGRVSLNDLVEYRSKRICIGYRPASMEGIDTQSTDRVSRFQWRGTSLWRFFTNDFGFIFVDHETSSDRPYQWIATLFRPTIFSSGGINLMTRIRQPPSYILNDFIRYCGENPILKLKSANMYYTREKDEDEIYYIRDLQID